MTKPYVLNTKSISIVQRALVYLIHDIHIHVSMNALVMVEKAAFYEEEVKME